MTGRRHASPATDAAAALLDELVGRGVRHVVLSPGSRSQALALAAAALERAGSIRLHVRVDERVAGFTALGIGRETRVPAAVVCTSGTAVANLLPAALEAHHAGVPLLLLTGDRPPELRGVGANQTTAQPGMFGSIVRFATDAPVPETTIDDPADGAASVVRASAARAYRAAIGDDARPAGPVHLNLPFREPLAGDLPDWFAVSGTAAAAAAVAADAVTEAAIPPADGADIVTLERGPRTVVVAGADAGADAEELAHLAGWPLIAEVVSGARFGRRLVHGYREALRDPALGGRVERAVVWGHPTLSREVSGLLSRRDVEVIALRGTGEELDLNGATVAAGAVRLGPGETDRDWLDIWMRASAAAVVDLDAPVRDADGLVSDDPRARRAAVSAELAALRRPLDRMLLVDAVWRATWPHDRLMFGSSRLVRVADAVLGGKPVPVHANRGVAGIDGTVATGLGIAIASQAGGAPGVTRVVLGDLALLHDAGALHMPPAEDEPRIQVIVGNDGGGTIFDRLEVARLASDADMDRVLYTPHDVSLEQLAAAYGWEHRRLSTRAALDEALTASVVGRQLLEVPLER